MPFKVRAFSEAGPIVAMILLRRAIYSKVPTVDEKTREIFNSS